MLNPCLLTLTCTLAAADRPNLVLIVSDDMGYADLPRFGRSEIATPQLDRLADAGVLCRNAYTSAPICVPARMGMITGRHQARWGVYTNVYAGPAFAAWNRERTLAELLREAGYATAIYGKWHLSGNTSKTKDGIPPDRRGYNTVSIIPGGMSAYFPGASLYVGNGKQQKAPAYLTDHFGDLACAFVEREAGRRPFFLHLAFNAVHAPLHALDADVSLPGYDRSRYVPSLAPGQRDPLADRAVYAAMLTALDRNVGRVLDALDRAGVAQETLVVFVNDNGGPAHDSSVHSYNMASNAPLRGHKFDCLEGGIRVPMLVRWPGRLPTPATHDGLVSTLDIVPTFLAAAHVPVPPGLTLDGVDLLPHLAGTVRQPAHAALHWRCYFGDPRQAQAAMRQGPWKVHQTGPIDRPVEAAAWALYDLDQDPGETTNLATRHADRVREMHQQYATWLAQMTPDPAPNATGHD
jgi:arylsulfatase A-like enzyme